MKAAASLRDRAAGYFVAPRPPAAVVVAPCAAPSPRCSAPRVAVLGSATHAAPMAGALAGALRTANGAQTAAVAIWAPEPEAAPPRHPVPSAPRRSGALEPPRLAIATEAADGVPQPRSVPASPAALRLAARLTGRGLAAAARGRLAWVRLAVHPVAAALAARRLSGALEAPVVLALAGPRTEVLEALLREQDLVVIVTEEPEVALARLAVAGCVGPAVGCAPLPIGPARLLALAGLSGARTLDPQLRTAIGRLVQPPAEPVAPPRAAAADPAGAD